MSTDVAERARLRRGRIVTAVVAALVVALVGGVALAGGFRAQEIHVTDLALGAPLVTGPYEVTLSSATVTHLSSENAWVVKTTGTIRRVDDAGGLFALGDDGFVFAALGLREQGLVPEQWNVAEPGTDPERQVVSPGVPAVPWHLTFAFPTEPGGTVLVGIYGQRYATKYLLDDELVWQNTEAVSKIEIPLERLPDDTY